MRDQRINPLLSEGLRRRTPTSTVTGKSEARESPPTSDFQLGDSSEGWTSAFRSPYRVGETGPSIILYADPVLKTLANLPKIDENLYQRIDKVGKGPPGLYFCNACAALRKSLRYMSKINALLVEIRLCNSCDLAHRKVNFSCNERYKEGAHRKCVLHEGAWGVCAHLSLKWNAITTRDWSTWPGYRRTRDGWTVTTSCKHPDHHVNERPAVTITFREGERKVPSGYVLSSTQDLYPRVDTPEKQVESCLSKVFNTLDAGCTMLCPHLRITPETLRSIASHPHSTLDGTYYLHSCQFCRFIVCLNLSDRQHPRIECENEMIVNTKGSLGQWSSFNILIDPESFNLRSDERAKHVLWCDDKQCATSFQYASWVVATTTLDAVKTKYRSDCRAWRLSAELARALEIGRSIVIEKGKNDRGEIEVEGSEWNSGDGERSRIWFDL